MSTTDGGAVFYELKEETQADALKGRLLEIEKGIFDITVQLCEVNAVADAFSQDTGKGKEARAELERLQDHLRELHARRSAVMEIKPIGGPEKAADVAPQD